jgi:hypothetical protein
MADGLKKPGEEPTISCDIERVGTGTAWRWTIRVNDIPMTFGHGRTKGIVESKAAEMMQAYTEVHYTEK